MVFKWEVKDESNREQLKRKYKQDKAWERPERWEGGGAKVAPP